MSFEKLWQSRVLRNTIGAVAMICALTSPAAAQLRQTFFVPVDETHVRDIGLAITSAVGETTHSVVSLSATADSTTVYYDHWEDGYEVDLENPVQASTETFSLDAGDFQVLESDIVLNPRDPATIVYDGRDRIGTTEQIAVTRAGWRLSEGTLLAGAIEVFPTLDWRSNFEFPLGQDIVSSQSWEYVAASVMAGETGAVFDVDSDGDGTANATITLQPGESTIITGIQTSGTISSSDPLQVVLLTGNIGSTFEARWFSLVPTETWGISYYSPVTTVPTSETRIFLYNPNASAITVSHESQQPVVTPFTYDNTTAGILDETTTPCGAPLVRTFNVTDTFTVKNARLGLNATHTYRGDVQVTLIAPSGTSQVILNPNGGDGDDNYDVLLSANSNNAADDGNIDDVTAPLYDRTVGSGNLTFFDGEAANGTWTIQVCDAFAGDVGTFNQAQLQLDEQTGTTLVTGTVSVPASGITEFTMPTDSAVHFFTAGGERFFGTGAVDWADTSSDWGFTLLPEDALATALVTGWAPGRDPASATNPLENGSPIWVSAIAATDLYVDYDGDPTTGALVDANGNQYDQLIPVDLLESVRLYDPNDTDQGGVRIYTLDGTLLKAAWGQDATTASGAEPAIDVGTTVIPLDALRALKEGTLLNDADGDGAIGPGDTMRYSILITNVSEAVVSGASVEDFGLDANLTYVADSTTIEGIAVPDDIAPATIFPLDEGGEPLATIGIGETVEVIFAVLINDPLPPGVTELVNQVRVSTSTQIEVGATVVSVVSPTLEITKTSNVVDDVVAGQTINYTVSVSNVSGNHSRGIKILDSLPSGTSYVTESTSATGFTDVFSGTLAVSDVPVGGIAFDEGTNPCAGTPLTRTFSVANDITIVDLDFGFNASHTFRGDIQAVLESPASTRVTVLSGISDGDDNYDVLLDDESANALDDASPDNVAAPFYDRTAVPDNALSAFDGESALGTWSLEICDDAGGDSGTYNNAELRITGESSTPLTRTNAAAAVNPLLDGDPLNLILAPDGFGLNPGQAMTVTYSVVVEDPLPFNSTTITNTAFVTSLEQVEPLTATVIDPVTLGAAVGDRVWLDVDGDGFQDIGEPGIANVTVNLFDPGGDGAVGGGDDVLIATALTDSNGNYLFDRLSAGSYFVDVDGSTVPTGLATSPGTTDPSAVVTLAAEEIRTDVDFGYTNASSATAIIGDRLWSDGDGDGIQDPGEPGIGGVTLELLDSAGAVVTTLMTADDGSYLFTGVAPGEYRVRVAASNFTGGNTLDGYAVTVGPQSEGANISDPVTVIGGDIVTDVDFGYDNGANFSITDRVWLDLNSDQVLNASERGIANVTVDLLDASGDVIATVISGSDGSFTFDGIEPGNYTISMSDNTGELIGLAGTTTAGIARQQAVTVVAADITGVNFGFNGEATLGDRVWSDSDGDGIQDANEVGLVGVTVELLDRGGSVIDTVVTDAFGNYLFEGIIPEQYSVRVDGTTLPVGFTQTGDPDVTLDGQSTTLLTLGDADLQLDFGYQNAALADISGNVFSDLDRDGIDDGVGEPGFESVSLVLLDSAGNIIAKTDTDANGDYSFEDLPAGDYQVAVLDDTGVLTDYLLTSGLDTVDVSLAGTDITDIDFGYARNAGTGAIGDFVWHDADRDGVQDAGESGLSGVTLQLFDAGPDGVIGGGDDVLIGSTITDANGGYVFGDLAPGAYYVDPDGTTVPAGLAVTTGTTDPSAIVLVSEGEFVDTVDFGYSGTTDSSAIGDRVWADVDGDGVQDAGEVGISGVTVTVVGPSGTFTTTTGDDGSWLVTGLAPGTYSVTVDSSTLPAAFDTVPTNGPASREYEVTSTADVLTADFGFDGPVFGSIGDTVFLDENADGIQGAGENGIAGVTVDLLDSGGNVVATTSTDSDGGYDFVGLVADDYQVQVTDIGQVLSGLNLSGGTNPTATINLAAGQDFNDADFGYAPSAGSGTIGSIVWNDISGDGVRQPGEPGLQGVTVALWHDINGDGVITPGIDNLLRSLTTDENGEYEFVGLLPADYLVDVTDTSGVLTGFSKTSGTAGIDDNSQADPYAVTLSTGSPNNDTADFGYQAATPRAISGTVFGDDNSDALFNGSETGVAGVPVVLYFDLDGDGVLDPEDPQIATTVANGSGDYSFPSLPDNRDYIVVVEPVGSAVSGQTQTTQTGTASVQPVTLAGADSVDNDFGFVDSAPAVVDPAVIGDRVWLDVDGDGIQDVGEPGIPNVDLNLYDVGLDGAVGGGDDVLLATTTTGADGSYSFGGLDAGTYYVDVVDPSVPTGLVTSPGTNDPSSAVTVALGDVIDTVDFGYTNDAATAVVGNYVWSDADGDGQQDPIEPGIGGVTLDLVSAGSDGVFGTGDDMVVDTVTTGDDGWYLFSGVAPGEYRVDVTDTGNELTGYTLTTGPQSASDPTAPFTVAAGDIYQDADFGYQDPTLSSVSDRLWQDIDGDGTQDVGEPGLAGVTINLLDDSGDVIATTVTDADGDFTFDGLEDGDYTLSVSDTDAVLREFVGTTPPATADALAVTIAGGDVTGVNFGYNQPGVIGDTVFSDSDGDDVQDPGELGIGGVTVQLWQDADGNGVFDNTVDTLVGSQVTAADGSYLFEGLAQGTYFSSIDSTQPALAGYSATTPDQEGGVNAPGEQIEASLANSAASFLAADFGYQNTALPDVSGNVFNDLDRDGFDDGAGEPGFLGVTLELRNASGVVVATTVTDANGDYSFLDVPAGNYAVAVVDADGVLDGFILTSSLDEIDITVAAADITDIDFGYARDTATGSIGDRVWLDSDGDGIQDGAETGLPGASVELYDAGPDGAVGGGDDVLVGTAVTDASGNYLFSGLSAGNYYAQLDTSSLPNAGSGLVVTTANPTTVIGLSEGENYPDADFGVGSAPATGAIGDRVWFDADGDGVQDPGETGIAGVEIVLTGPGCSPCTTTTGADGSYLFTGLTPGAYRVDFTPATLPAIYDPSPTNTTGNWDVDNLMGGDLVTNADFGFGAAGAVGSIGDLVFRDLDGDGTLDPGEPGIEGVTVDLLDASGTVVLATTTTDENGLYDFLGLAAATYQVRVSDTANVLSGLNLSAGLNPTGAIVLASGQDYDDADFGYAPSGGTGSVGNLVWHDSNGDGNRDAGESGMEGVTVELWRDVNGNGVLEPGTDNLVRVTSTDINGEYVFTGLPAGDYLVDVTDELGVVDGFTKTTGLPDTDNNSQADPYAVTVGAGAVITADFGYFAGSNADILGTVFFDVDGDGIEDPIDFGVEQVAVFLYRDLDGDGVIDPDDPRIGVTIADANGDYIFEDLPPGDYVVAVDAGGTFVDGAAQTTQLLTGSIEPVTLAAVDSTDNDFGFNRAASVALVVDVRTVRVDGRTYVEWRTAAEAGTAGFQLYQADGDQAEPVGSFVPSPWGSPQGARYRVEMPGAGRSQVVWLEEIERTGFSRFYGPYELQAAGDAESWSAALEGDGWQTAALDVDSNMRQRLEAARVASNAVNNTLAMPGSSDRVKLKVDQRGLQFVDAASIAQGLGIDQAAVQSDIDSAMLRLSRGSREVSYLPAAGGLYFFGQAVAGETYTSTEVYWLERAAGSHMLVSSAGAAGASTGGTFAESLHLEEEIFPATFVARDADLDYWHWFGIIANHPSLGFADVPLDLPRVDTSAPARVTVHLRGAGDTNVPLEHHARFEIDGVTVGETFFDGLADHTVTFDLAAGVLGADGATLRVRGLLDTGAAQSFFYVDAVRVQYQRQLVAHDGSLEGSLQQRSDVTIEGFESSELLVLDVANGDRPEWLSTPLVEPFGAGFRASFESPPGFRFLAQELATAHQPVVEADQPSDLRSSANAGTYLVLTSDELIDAARRLASLRQADFGSSQLVRITDVMDEFAAGRFHPPAIRSFLAYAARNWAQPPTHVVLLGKGSLDYQNRLGQGGNLMPPLLSGTPYGLYSSDLLYSDFDGDNRPDVALGRIPALLLEEANAYIDKVVAYESSLGSWAENALLLADNDDMGGQFSQEIAEVATLLPPDLEVEIGYLGVEGPAALRDRLFAATQRGVGLVDWMGHGGLDRLADEGILLNADVGSLGTEGRWPIFALMSCNVARFELPGFNSLAEELTMADGGAIAVLAPSGLALDVDSFDANRFLAEQAFADEHDTLGEVFQRVMRLYADAARLESDVRVYQFMGDPGLPTAQSGLEAALIFADGFESGDTSRWSNP